MVDFDISVSSLRAFSGKVDQKFKENAFEISEQNSKSFNNKAIKNLVTKFESSFNDLDRMFPTDPSLGQRVAKQSKLSEKDGRYSVLISRHIENSISILILKKLRFMNATDDIDLLRCLQNVFPKFTLTPYTSEESIAAFDNIVVFGRFQSRIENDSKEALRHLSPDVHSKAVLIMFHQTRGSKKAEDVFEMTYKHENIKDQLHIPFVQYQRDMVPSEGSQV